MLFSMRTLVFLPVEIGRAFLAVALAILLSFSKSATRAVAFVSFVGGVAAAIAALHLTEANSDPHVRRAPGSRRSLLRETNGALLADRRRPFFGERVCTGSSNTSISQGLFAHHQCDGTSHLPPAIRFVDELLSPCGGESIKLGLAIVLAHSPKGRNPTAILKPMERGIE
jgi:hypothetical protein